MERTEILRILEETGSIKKGHFKLTSGRHSDTYIQCARIQEFPVLNNRLAAEAVKRLLYDLPQDTEVDVVAAPAVGGIVFGYAVSTALEKRFVWSEREDGKMKFRRSFEINPGENVLVCEDVVTTGGSVQELISLVEKAGGIVIGVVSMIYRGGATEFDAPFYPLIEVRTPSWEPDECELCAKGIELDSPGSRHIAEK